VGLGHRRLSIIDLSTGQQPMTSGNATLVFNGELYNYLELRDTLRGRGHAFQTSSDTEVILRAYLEWGDACVREFNGMFAFVLHDHARKRVLAARDHFGIKPLYFSQTEDRILFASEIKSLLQYPDVQPAPNYAAMQDYLTFQFVLGDATLFQGICKLQPGHMMAIDLPSGQVTRSCFWEPKFTIDPYHTEEYFVYELQRLLDDTIGLQMRSDVPVGAYLSGGYDSSIVATLASRRSAGTFRTFTGAFREGPQFDESRYALAVAGGIGAEPHVVWPGQQDFTDLLPKLIYHMDEPTAGPGLFPQYMTSQLAAGHVKVVLGGQGGDEIFGGYARYLVAYFEQALKGAIYESNDEEEHLVSLRSIVPNLPYLKQYVPMLQQFWGDDLFGPMDRRYFRLIDRSGGQLDLFSGDFQRAWDRDAIFSRFQRVFNHPDTLSYYNKMTHFDVVSSLPALLHVEDRVSMANSIESRVPLLDRRIADLVFSMPPAMKFLGGELKYVFRHATRGMLPPMVADRKDKMGFPVPLHLWAKGSARDFFHDVLMSQACRERGLFDMTGVERLLGEESAFGRKLWGLVCLELWFTTFIDAGAVPAEPAGAVLAIGQ
jgi:asparagine synthase (glutamine-hydrolysing)